MSEPISLVPYDGEALLYDAFYSEDIANAYLLQLLGEIPWRQDSMKMYGKEIQLPRLTASFGEQYVYSGIIHPALPMPKLLLSIMEDIRQVCGAKFNATLLNYYRDGNDSMGWHSDAEASLGRNPVVASLSLGQARDFQFRHRVNKADVITTTLGNGSMLLMQGEIQHRWVHQLPKRKKAGGVRINITFRNVLHRDGN